MKKQSKNTHIEFDGKNIHVSPNLVLIFHFLSQIEREVTSVLEINSKLFEINKGYSDLLGIIKDLVIRLEKYEPEVKKEKFKIPSGNSLNVIAKKFTQQPMIRSQMIVLMSSLEVLFALDVAYRNKTSNESLIREHMMNKKQTITFLDEYVFNKKNIHYKFKEKKLSKIKSQNLRKLRNGLIHFFSLPDNFVVNFAESIEEKNINDILISKGEKDILFFSVRDLEKLVKYAHLLRVSEWIDDFRRDKEQFKADILNVKKIIEERGAKLMELDNFTEK